MLTNVRLQTKLPKSAIPCDNLSKVFAPTIYGLHPYIFVYATNKRVYIKRFEGTPVSPVLFYSLPLKMYVSFHDKNSQ